MSSSQPSEVKPAERTSESSQVGAQAAQKAEPKESFFQNLKNKLFPKSQGQEKPTETETGTSAPDPVPPPPEAGAPAAAASSSNEGATAAVPEEKKPGLIDRIKDLFKPKKEKPPTATAEEPSGQAAEVAEPEGAASSEPPASETMTPEKETLQDLQEGERPLSLFIEKGEKAAQSEGL
jgi:hypothetical protein